mmetsp:Transcript_23572/g.60506  ORF Transcript_23572/g.60506 Transcript_23572/m.60506 type:complete len:209 (-) Transcript_23572:136-762(-)
MCCSSADHATEVTARTSERDASTPLMNGSSAPNGSSASGSSVSSIRDCSAVLSGSSSLASAPSPSCCCCRRGIVMNHTWILPSKLPVASHFPDGLHSIVTTSSRWRPTSTLVTLPSAGTLCTSTEPSSAAVARRRAPSATSGPNCAWKTDAPPCAAITCRARVALSREEYATWRQAQCRGTARNMVLEQLQAFCMEMLRDQNTLRRFR